MSSSMKRLKDLEENVATCMSRIGIPFRIISPSAPLLTRLENVREDVLSMVETLGMNDAAPLDNRGNIQEQLSALETVMATIRREFIDNIAPPSSGTSSSSTSAGPSTSGTSEGGPSALDKGKTPLRASTSYTTPSPHKPSGLGLFQVVGGSTPWSTPTATPHGSSAHGDGSLEAWTTLLQELLSKYRVTPPQIAAYDRSLAERSEDVLGIPATLVVPTTKHFSGAGAGIQLVPR
ncbi:hypothetical protein HDU96_004100, partial [Phlyctochytrium bullatum]